MYSIKKTSLYAEQGSFLSDTSTDSLDPDPTDPWMFTDPVARQYYAQRDLIDQLEEDIRDYVMFDGCWAPEEVEYKLEIRRLLRQGFITSWNYFGYLSPHPTIYRTVKKGTLEVSGQLYHFNEAEDLIFEPWLARYSHPGLNGPLHIGYISPVSNPRLCCDAFPHLCIHCDKTRAIMREILSYQNKEE